MDTQSIDMWFYALVASSVILRLLLSNEPNPSLRAAFASTLSAFIVAKIGYEPLLEHIPSDNPAKYEDALIVVLALVGNEIVLGILSAAKNPKEALTWVIQFLKRRPPS